MHYQKSLPIFLSLLLSTLFLHFSYQLTSADSVEPTAGGNTISRPHDELVLTATDLPDFLNQPIPDLRLYSFEAGVWAPIPFQIDEVNITGTYVFSEDLLFDANDQLVFMGYDAGERSNCGESFLLYPADHTRAEISITDPLNGETGYLYLFQTTAVPTSTSSYINWNQTTQTISGTFNSSYQAVYGGVKPTPHLGLSDLFINGSPDILDRQHLQLNGTLYVPGFGCALPFPVPFSYNEESLVTLIGGALITPTIVGPIRMTNGSLTNASYNYGSKFSNAFDIDPSLIANDPGICSIDVSLIRTAMDLTDPTIHGVNSYFNSNGATAVIDGTPDSVGTTPLANWTQQSGGTYGGVVSIITDINPGTGTTSNYYLDQTGNGSLGDGHRFGAAGGDINNSGDSSIAIASQNYILPAGTTANVGDLYYQYATTPLTNTTNSETCICSTSPPILNAPSINISGGLDINLSWANNNANLGGYIIFSSSSPYNIGSILATPTFGTDSYQDLAVLNSPATHIFYTIVANNCDSSIQLPSKQMGKFEFAIIPGL